MPSLNQQSDSHHFKHFTGNLYMQQDFKYVVPKISNVQYTFYNLMHLLYLDQLLIIPICL